jgi:histone H3/H4
VHYLAEEFTIAPMRRLIKKFGDLKISEEATEEMRRVVGEIALRIAKEATDNARKEGRKTVLERDIKVAYTKEMDKEKQVG